MKLNLDKKSILSILGIALISIFFAWSLNNYEIVWSIFLKGINICLPLILGFVIAFVINIPMSFFETHCMTKVQKPALIKLRRALGILISLLIIIAIFAFIFILVVPEIVNTFVLLGSAISQSWPQVVSWVNDLIASEPVIAEYIANLNIETLTSQSAINDAIAYITSSFTTVLGGAIGVVSSISGGVTNGVFALIFAIYILMAKEVLKSQMQALFEVLLPHKAFVIVSYIARMSKKVFSSFVTGQCAEAVILGTLFFIGMTIFRFPHATTISVLVGVCALLPIVGAILGSVVGAFLILMVDPILAVWYIIFSIVMQQIEGNLIYPKVVGGSVGLPGLWVLAAVTIGGSMWGVIGMLVMVPIFSILYALIKLMVIAGRQSKELKTAQEHNPKQAGNALLDAIVKLENEEQDKKRKPKETKTAKKNGK